jgi:hypothetical protein
LTKKGENYFCLCCFYGRFLSSKSAIVAPTTMIATNKPAIAGIKYWSATDCCAIGDGVGVGAAGSTAKVVSELDGQ